MWSKFNKRKQLANMMWSEDVYYDLSFKNNVESLLENKVLLDIT